MKMSQPNVSLLVILIYCAVVIHVSSAQVSVASVQYAPIVGVHSYTVLWIWVCVEAVPMILCVEPVILEWACWDELTLQSVDYWLSLAVDESGQLIRTAVVVWPTSTLLQYCSDNQDSLMFGWLVCVSHRTCLDVPMMSLTVSMEIAFAAIKFVMDEEIVLLVLMSWSASQSNVLVASSRLGQLAFVSMWEWCVMGYEIALGDKMRWCVVSVI